MEAAVLMPAIPPVVIPLLPVTLDAQGRRRITPTDVASFIRLEQCERYLRLRLHERSAGRGFLRDYGVRAQQLPPLLARSGAVFEERLEAEIGERFRTRRLSGEDLSPSGPDDNLEVAAAAAALAAGESLILLQPRLDVSVADWRIKGVLDLLHLERNAEGELSALIVDMKSTERAKVEHRLQVAFYQHMLESLLGEHDIELGAVRLAILYRGPAPGDHNVSPDELERQARERANAERLLSVRDAQLELIGDATSYLEAVADLVTGGESRAAEVAERTFEEIPYCLTSKCDGCVYNEFCMKWSAEHDDLSLIPSLGAQDKRALRAQGVATTAALAQLKQPPAPGATTLVAAPGHEELARRLGATWPVGPRLDELVQRARRYRKWKHEPIEALSYIPNTGYGSLPFCGPEQNPNLIRIYIDSQHDYLHNRLYMLGALVVASEGGEEQPARRRSVVRLAAGPPTTAAIEEQLLLDWIDALLHALAAVAAPDDDGGAPIHLIFFDAFEQRLLLEALSRHFATIAGATPLYDFVTQLAAFDSPVVTFLDHEIRDHKNYPMVCQSLQAVAGYLRFDWNAPEPYRTLFRARLFDSQGKLDGDLAEGEWAWYTARARFSSQIPLEFAYGAWDDLPGPPRAGADPYRVVRGRSREQLASFQARRLEAIEHVAHDFKGNKQTTKTPFKLPDLATWHEQARDLAHALDEFVTIERHVELAAWKSAHLPPPERRALSGVTLIVRYVEADQALGVAALHRENDRRRRLRDEHVARWRAEHPAGERLKLPKEQSAESKWSMDGLTLRLRIETSADCSLDELLALATLRAGANLVICPRWEVDSRPDADPTPYTPTPKSMLYALRGTLASFEVQRDAGGRALCAWAHVALQDPRADGRPYAFKTMAAKQAPPVADALYTLDEDPNSWYAYFQSRMTRELCDGADNALYARLAAPAEQRVDWPAVAAAAQARFFDGLLALHVAEPEHWHAFEAGKRDFIAAHGAAPALLVQGPPGTGKSYSTAFALLARLQGALAAEHDFRVLVSCKTHAATDVLLSNIVDAQARLRAMFVAQPELAARFFEPGLLHVDVVRAFPRDTPPVGAGALYRENDPRKPAGQLKSADAVLAQRWIVVAATPGGVYRMLKDKWKPLSGHPIFDCLVLDEASQMSLPEAMLAAAPLKSAGQLIVVGDHRQMPPIVKHAWASEPRRTFQQYRSYESLFEALLPLNPPTIRFAESFRLHADMAEFLRREIYAQDGINYHSLRDKVLAPLAHADDFVSAVLAPDYPIVVVVHDEAASQQRNPFEQRLIAPVLAALSAQDGHALDALEGLGVVVPHRAQRAELQQHIPCLTITDSNSGAVTLSAVDTVERFQGGERTVIVVSATESDRGYLLAASNFLLDPRRLTVALSRAKEKLVLVASRSVFELFSADDDTFANALLWKNLLRRTCVVPLWEGEREGVGVHVWGNLPHAG